MRQRKPRSIAATIVGLLALGAGLAAFLVPLRHAGPYGIPGRGLVGGLLCLAISAVLLARGAPTLARVVALLAAPFVLFLALYGALAELEEVVVLYSGDAELRLWVVDASVGVSLVRRVHDHVLDRAVPVLAELAAADADDGYFVSDRVAHGTDFQK